MIGIEWYTTRSIEQSPRHLVPWRSFTLSIRRRRIGVFTINVRVRWFRL